VHSPIERALRDLAAGDSLEEALAHEAFGQLMRGEATAAQIGALLAALRVKQESAAEVAGAVRALRDAMVRVDRPNGPLVDTCGTGGGTVSTFNISTTAALVVVAAGVKVAKHGNRSYTSKCGSADLLEALGIDITMTPERAADLLSRIGMTFLFAPAFHPAMRFAAPVRREIGIPTIMNLIGPLANPAGVTRQLVGIADRTKAPLLAEVLCRLEAEHALVVHAIVGMDEVAPVGVTEVWEVRAGSTTTWTLDPGDYGLAHGEAVDLAGGVPADNAKRVERLLLRPESDPAGRAAVILNAGAALYVSGSAATVGEGLDRAAEALHSGAASGVLDRLRGETTVSTSE